MRDGRPIGEGSFLCDLIRMEGAETVASYGDDFYKGLPAITRNRYGKGEAWYVATRPDEALCTRLTERICKEKGVRRLFAAEEGIESACREKKGVKTYFVISHRADSGTVDLGDGAFENLLDGTVKTGRAAIGAGDVWVLRPQPGNGPETGGGQP